MAGLNQVGGGLTGSASSHTYVKCFVVKLGAATITMVVVFTVDGRYFLLGLIQDCSRGDANPRGGVPTYYSAKFS